MLAHNHLAAGVAAGGILYGLGLIDVWITALIIIGAILPDIDYFLASTETHRNLPTHAPSVYAVLATLFFIPLTQPVGAFAIGALVHLILDSFDWGVMWLYPFSKKRFFVRVTSWAEYQSDRLLSLIEVLLVAFMLLGSYLIGLWSILFYVVYIPLSLYLTARVWKKS